MDSRSNQLTSEFLKSSTPLVTLTLFDFRGIEKAWAFQQMGTGRLHLKNIEGLCFWKLLGTGKGIGFSIIPDLAKYGFLGVWSSYEKAVHFLSKSTFMRQYLKHAANQVTFKLIPIKADGLWSGQNPFLPLFGSSVVPIENQKTAVLTRASIHWQSLVRFWKHVPYTSEELTNAEGLEYSIGLGEAPLIHQATFSIWKNANAMKHFAYNSPMHQSVIKKTRQENWYSEDLFARFLVMEGHNNR